jgi:hypothetical protein
VPIHQRLRDLVDAVANRPPTTNPSATSPPGTRAADASSRQPEATEADRSRGEPHSPPTSRSDDLALAQGQELLGPCRDCNGYWTRELTRGQKPQSCPVCKRLGPPTSHQQ